MRFFQEREYISLDYARRDALRVGVKKPGPEPEFGFEKLTAPATEPLQAELEASWKRYGHKLRRKQMAQREEQRWSWRAG